MKSYCTLFDSMLELEQKENERIVSLLKMENWMILVVIDSFIWYNTIVY